MSDPKFTSVTRRGIILGAAGGAIGLGAVLGGTPAEASGPGRRRTPRLTPGGTGVAPGVTAFVQVTTMTVWSEPGLDRALDAPSLTNPVDLDAWNANMQDTPSRQWLTGKLETQAVLGTRVIVDEVEGEWAKVVVVGQPTPKEPRGYPGWAPVRQLVVDKAFERRTRTASTATVTAKRTGLTKTPSGRHPWIEVSFDTVLPVVGTTGRSVEVAVPGGASLHLPRRHVVVRRPGQKAPTPTVEDIIATGKRFLGLRYLWAGVSAWGFDCSGFTYTLFHHHGITIPRDAGPQLNHSGYPKVAREDLRRGDLVFFATKPGGTSIRHVAVYLGDDRIMQSPNAARSVEIMSLTEYDPTGEYAGAVRVLP